MAYSLRYKHNLYLKVEFNKTEEKFVINVIQSMESEKLTGFNDFYVTMSYCLILYFNIFGTFFYLVDMRRCLNKIDSWKGIKDVTKDFSKIINRYLCGC